MGCPGEICSVSALFPFCLLINSLFSNHFPGRRIQVLLYRSCEASAGRGDDGRWWGELLSVVSLGWADIESLNFYVWIPGKDASADGMFTI